MSRWDETDGWIFSDEYHAIMDSRPKSNSTGRFINGLLNCGPHTPDWIYRAALFNGIAQFKDSDVLTCPEMERELQYSLGENLISVGDNYYY